MELLPISGRIPIGDIPPDIFDILTAEPAVIEEPGFIIIYVDNRSLGKNAWFDNVQVLNYQGEVSEENHYYPFGLTLSLDATLNKQPLKYQGIELETHFGLETYETFYRGLDPQLGRFNSVDPKPNFMESPYAAMGNNPVNFMDPMGDTLLTKADKRIANRIEKQINKRNENLNRRVTKLNGQIAAAEAKGNSTKANGLKGDLADANSSISSNIKTLGNLNSIRNDQTQAYTFNELPAGSKEVGTVLRTMRVNGSDQSVVNMNVLNDANAVHELTHAAQGAILNIFSFELDDALKPVRYIGSNLFAQQLVNSNSDIETYNAQYAFDPESMPASSVGGVPSSINGINAFYIGGLNGINRNGISVPIYPHVRNMVTSLFQFIKLRP